MQADRFVFVRSRTSLTRRAPHAITQSIGDQCSCSGSPLVSAGERGVFTTQMLKRASLPLEHSRQPSGMPSPRAAAGRGGRRCECGGAAAASTFLFASAAAAASAASSIAFCERAASSAASASAARISC